MVRSAGFPITATSANLSGAPECADPNRVIRMFEGRVDMIIDGGFTPGGRPSTILDLTGAAPKILREGAITPAQLQGYLE
jgi:L-threonylcarbamoyladenylate synthase